MTTGKYNTNQQKTKYKWWFVVDVPSGEFDKLGNPKRKQVRKRGFKTEKEAKEAERKFLNSFETGCVELKGDTTTEDVINFFLTFARNEGKYAKGTISNYEGYLNNHMENLRSVSIKKLTPVLIQNWHRDLYKKGNSDHVYNGCLKLLKKAFSYAIELKQITTNPFRDVKPVKIPLKHRDRFPIAELKTIIDSCINHMPEFYCIFCLSVLTGMRLGEYSAIMPRDIKRNENRYTINVDKQITRNEFKYKTKTSSSTRTVDLSDRVYDIIQWHIEKYNIPYDDFLFRADSGGMIYAKWVERKFKKLLTLCGYPEDFCRVHDLRGQYVDIMHLCGVPIVYTSRQIGHSDPKVTSKVYTQILDELPVEANRKMDSLLFDSGTSF